MVINFLNKIIQSLKNNGVRNTIKKFVNYFYLIFLNHIKPIKVSSLFPSKEYLDQIKNFNFTYKPKISILITLFNTEKIVLQEMLNSVMNQTYSNWELCLADESDDAHCYVKEYFNTFVDRRIKYKKIVNSGISDNTNECIKIANGDYFALLNQDDILLPHALTEVVKQINNYNADFIYSDDATCNSKANKITRFAFKPDFSPDFFRTFNYLGNFIVFKNSLLGSVVRFDSDWDGSQDFDLFLRLTEKSRNIRHISKVLYLCREGLNSTVLNNNAKQNASFAGKLAVEKHLNRIEVAGDVSVSDICTTLYKISYKIIGNPKISILIPNKDHKQDLEKCINSIITKTTWKNYEIIIVENNSLSVEINEYYKQLVKDHNSIIKVIKYEKQNKGFNFSDIVNYGTQYCSGEYFVLLNNDTEVITADWLEQMLMYAQRKDVGAVGAKLYFPNNTIQHGGLIIGLRGFAGHAFLEQYKDSPGYMYLLKTTKNVSAVTAACLMVRKTVFDEVSGFCTDLPTDYDDVDFCLKIRERGYLITWTPYAELYHYESKSRGTPKTKDEKLAFEYAYNYMKKKWSSCFEQGDPYYNPNLSLEPLAVYQIKRITKN